MRQRFNREEKAAFTVGAEIEWRNGRYWYPGKIVEPISKPTSGGVFERCGLVNLGPDTKTLSHGQFITGTPTHIRIPQKPEA